ncbi:MAG: VWA domain-containing protein [Shimia sp.]
MISQDVAFVIDTTGSMFDDIAAVKENASDILDALFDGSDSRAALVTYNDFGFAASLDALNASVDLEFTDDEEAVRAAIDAISVSGGGDFPEFTFEGLYLALSGAAGEWREDAEDRKIVLFGDATAKDGELADEVFALAFDLRADIEISDVPEFSGMEGVSGTSFTLSTETGPSVEIYTVAVAGSPAETIEEFASIAETTGGVALDAADGDELVDTIVDIIETLPPLPVLGEIEGDGDDDELVGSIIGEAIKGKAGDDLLVGLAGDDILLSGGGDDFAFGGDGDDFITGGAGNDILDGGAGNDTIDGGRGRDIIFMGDGADVATGGRSGDAFVFTGSTTDGGKIITDLEMIDIIDVSVGELTFLGNDKFTGAADEIRFREDKDRLMVDIDGDKKTDIFIQVSDGFTAEDIESLLIL